jgi:hypothetical protein
MARAINPNASITLKYGLEGLLGLSLKLSHDRPSEENCKGHQVKRQTQPWDPKKYASNGTCCGESECCSCGTDLRILGSRDALFKIKQARQCISGN